MGLVLAAHEKERMMLMRNQWLIVQWLVGILGAALLLSGCGGANSLQRQALMVKDVRVATGVTPDRPAAVYFTIEGGPEATRLVSVQAEMAQRTEIHEHAMVDGMMTMRKVPFVAVPALEKVAFKPGGYHVMVWGINPAAIKADRFPMVFIFANGDRIIGEGTFLKPGEDRNAAASGADGEHKGH